MDDLQRFRDKRFSWNAIALGTFSQNITKRKKAEDAVRKSEEQLRALSNGLEQEVHSRTAELEQRNTEILQQSEHLRGTLDRLVKRRTRKEDVNPHVTCTIAPASS